MKPGYPGLLVFDLDGTLVDSAPDIAFAIDATLCSLGMEPAGERRVRSWIGDGLSMTLKRALAGAMNPPAEVPLFHRAYPLFADLYRQHVSRLSRLYPGVLEGLRHLKDFGFRLACVTNKHSRFTEPLVEEIGLAGFFDAVASGDSFEKRKPDPLPLLEIARRFAVAPSTAIMVGDSANDVRAARAAGFNRVICVPYGYHAGSGVEVLCPDHIVDSICELPRWLCQAA